MLFQGYSDVAINKCTFSHSDINNTFWIIFGDWTALNWWHLTRVISSIIIRISCILQEWIVAVVISVLFLVLVIEVKFILILNARFKLKNNEVEVHKVGDAIQNMSVVDHNISHPLFDSWDSIGHNQKDLIKLNTDELSLLKKQVLLI